MVGALDGLYWSRALGLPVYHGLPHDYHESSGDSSGDAMTNATNELRAFTRLGRNAMGGCPKWNSYFNREDMWENDDRPLVFWMALGFLILRQPALKVRRCGTSICSITRDIGSCTTLQDIGSCNRVNRVSRWLIARKTLALWEFGLSKDGLFLAQGVHILRCNVGRSQGDARFLHPKRG